MPFAGFDGATFTNASNAGAIFSPLQPFDERDAKGLTATRDAGRAAQARCRAIQDAFVITIPPPPVRGIGNAGGFKMMLQDRARPRACRRSRPRRRTLVGRGQPDARPRRRVHAVQHRARRRSTPTSTARRPRSSACRRTASSTTLQVYLGSAYVNDFNYLGRTYRVTAQADGQFRADHRRHRQLKTRNAAGAMVPLGAVATLPATSPAPIACRATTCSRRRGAGQHGARVSRPARRSTRWRSSRRSTCRPASASNGPSSPTSRSSPATPALLIFGASVLFVFLVLAAQYESWTLPLAVMLIVPMCLLAAVTGLLLRGMDVNILAQIGFVVLVGLAAKNAILIVEFAKPGRGARARPRSRPRSQAARTRLRPILMTSLRLHPRRRAAGHRDRRRRRDAPVARHRGVLRHAGRDHLRPDLHAGLLRDREQSGRPAAASPAHCTRGLGSAP